MAVIAKLPLLEKNGGRMVPEHLAVIMDGNGRWATARGKPRSFGHREGVKVIENIAEYCVDEGIKVLSLYVFSTENRQRPKEEVDGLFSLANKYFSRISDFNKKNYRILVSGSNSELPYNLVIKIKEAERATANNNGLVLNMCFNYGGRDEIVNAVKRIITDAPSEINEETIMNYMYKKLPPPDLIIRTGGQQRLSNFLTYQSAYSELYFTDVLWPDFNKECFDEAIREYKGRKRSYGRV